MMTFQIYGKIKNVPNHQPEISCTKFDCFKLVNNQWQSTSSIFRYLNHPKFALLSQVFPLKLSDVFSICPSFLHHFSIISPPFCPIPYAPWCWNIYQHWPEQHHPLMSVNRPAPWSIWVYLVAQYIYIYLFIYLFIYIYIRYRYRCCIYRTIR